MFRLAIAGLGVVLLGAAAYFVPWPLVAGYLPGIDAVPLFATLALIVSVVSAAAALRATRHAARLRADIHLLARSVDIALREIATRTDKEAAGFSDMTSSVAREIERLSEQVAMRDDIAAGAQAAIADNVVPHPSARRARNMPQSPDQPAAVTDPGTIEAAYRRAVAAGEFDISLQPIVSVARSAATGFEVFANLPLEGGQRIDVRRPAEAAASAETAIFERILLNAALQAGRKRLGAASVSMPLHVAISEAMLGDSKEFSAVLDMLQFYPDLSRSFVLSMPAGLLDPSGQYAQALDLLAAGGVRFAAEGWNEAANAAAPVGVAGLTFVKIPANRLLDRERARRKLVPATTIIERIAADNVTVVATEVATDEDAVTLIDLGVDLMSGPRFGGPKRLKPEGGNRPGRLALI
jgi:cyclic-di-GMP phosphodiesterase TipF (flagellum assembly factor)